MKNRIISAATVLLLAATIAAVTYRIGVEAGEDRVLTEVCNHVGLTWDRSQEVCRSE